jgi:hypothetical protein
MRRIRPDVDIIMDILKAVLEARPLDAFVQSLLKQYQERGGLSKKQLEGLYGKASKLDTLSVGKLATLEAIIMKMKGKQRSELPPVTPLYIRDEETGKMIDAILAKYPEHKRVLFFQSKYTNNELFSPVEIAELKRFDKLLK